jgi:hypothetical protein
VSLTGCTECGLVLSSDAPPAEDEPLSEDCPECSHPMGEVTPREAAQLTRERALAIKWRSRLSPRDRGIADDARA